MDFLYEENIDEIDTFEAFFKGYVLKENKLLIPYVNLGVSEHPLNRTTDLLHLNYSYVICIDVILIKYNGNLVYDDMIGKLGNYQLVYLGGTDLEISANVEYQIFCKKAFLQITEKTKLSKTFWIPTKSGILDMNMDKKEVEHFFSLRNLPENLQTLF